MMNYDAMHSKFINVNKLSDNYHGLHVFIHINPKQTIEYYK